MREVILYDTELGSLRVWTTYPFYERRIPYPDMWCLTPDDEPRSLRIETKLYKMVPIRGKFGEVICELFFASVKDANDFCWTIDWSMQSRFKAPIQKTRLKEFADKLRRKS